MEWETFGDDHWIMRLRCGECGGWLQAVVDNQMAAAMDVALDRQEAAIAAAVRMLESERMAAEAERFIAALDRDLIDAGDFAR